VDRKVKSQRDQICCWYVDECPAYLKWVCFWTKIKCMYFSALLLHRYVVFMLIYEVRSISSITVLVSKHTATSFFFVLHRSGAVNVNPSADDTPLVTWCYGLRQVSRLIVDWSPAAGFWCSSCEYNHRAEKFQTVRKTEWSEPVHLLLCSNVLRTIDIYSEVINWLVARIHTA